MKPGPPPEFGSLYRYVNLLKKPHIWFDRHREVWMVRKYKWARACYTMEGAFKYARGEESNTIPC